MPDTQNSDALPPDGQNVRILFNAGSQHIFHVDAVFNGATVRDLLKLKLSSPLEEAVARKAENILLEFPLLDAFHQIKCELDSLATVPNPITKEDVHYIFLKPFLPGKRVQRRNFFRLPIKLPLQFRKIASIQAVGQSDFDSFAHGQTFDLSGGGMAFASPITLKKDDLIYAEFTLDDNVYRLCGKVVIIRENQKDNPHSCIAGVEFYFLHRDDQESLVRALFHQMNLNKQKNK